MKYLTPGVSAVVFAVMNAMMAVSVTENRRADDVSLDALLTMVQNQASSIQTLQADMASLKHTVQQQANTISTLTSTMNAVNTRVAFSAHMSTEPATVAESSPFIFDAIITNLGSGYNPLSGIFTAPVSGLYVFYLHLMDHGSESTMHVAVVKDGTVIGKTTVEGDDNTYDKGASFVTTRVAKGQQVYVRKEFGGNRVEGTWYCSFHGFLVLADTE